MCDWELTRQLDRVRRETLDSFRIVTNDDAYYSQFISRPGVLIKAPSKVDPEALKKAAGNETRLIDLSTGMGV